LYGWEVIEHCAGSLIFCSSLLMAMLIVGRQKRVKKEKRRL